LLKAQKTMDQVRALGLVFVEQSPSGFRARPNFWRFPSPVKPVGPAYGNTSFCLWLLIRLEELGGWEPGHSEAQDRIASADVFT
jgi:hypothetical protein